MGDAEVGSMKGVLLEIPEQMLEQRRICGSDRWDEVWEGVLHMVSPPSVRHQDLEWQIETWLRVHWVPTRDGNKVFHQVALSSSDDWVKDYRTPDVILFSREHSANLRPTYCHGPCTVAVEIRSPDDESYEKLEFYSKLGVREVWVIGRDDKRPEIYSLESGAYRKLLPGQDGWLRSARVPVMMKHNENILILQIPDQDASCQPLA